MGKTQQLRSRNHDDGNEYRDNTNAITWCDNNNNNNNSISYIEQRIWAGQYQQKQWAEATQQLGPVLTALTIVAITASSASVRRSA
jgi:hypothetical protein